MTRRPLPSLRSLQAFEAFAQTGSMSRAGEALHVTHGAVSRQIKALEAQVGARLVAGPRHRLALTAAGQELAASLSAAFDMVSAALPGAASKGELTVSCQSTFALKWLIPRLPAFLARHPQTGVRIVEGDPGLDLGRGDAQAAIRLMSGPTPAGVKSVAFLDHAYGPVVAPARLAAHGAREGLLQGPRLSSETFPLGWSRWAEDMDVTLPAAPEQRFAHNTYLIEAAAAGLGAGVTAYAFVERDLAAGRLVAPWGFTPLPTRFHYLRGAAADNPLADAFGAWLRVAGRPDAPV
ncbi:MAG: LysR family transcriptional regulator [Alphaproteobacteria bacterium]|nr:LysR family transcriptional regulator [Alphaproteobacteria bacterium]MBU1516659.1 LysR family transcriptional regulator [Alphaproteobacteria bacterium]MBU2094415.1 LysR family transcriptional regulator [Alphaproteobacteria bacterium]MBU2152642.1 LysR family transcriptional regulator [Alphaproteobacteria bacterium]MBU2307587.1 LysR family transcriptional regulator [Alphaproteobacteria bacterium]